MADLRKDNPFLRDPDADKKKKSKNLLVAIYTPEEFLDGIDKRIFSDKEGIAQLMFNGVIDESYLVYIDEKKIIHKGSGFTLFPNVSETFGKDVKIQYTKKMRI